MIMAMMRTHGSFRKIHDRMLHVLVTIEVCSKSVIIYAFQ